MHIKLAYGHEQVSIDVPDNWINGRCYRPRPVEQCADARAELIAALQNVAEPFDLEKLCQGRKECVIAVDAEAPALMEDVLPELVDQIEEVGGITASAITILITNSAVAPRQKDELIALVPEDLRRRHRVEAHDPLDRENVKQFGKSPIGVDLALNAIYCSADLKVILGGGASRPDSWLLRRSFRCGTRPNESGERDVVFLSRESGGQELALRKLS